MIKNDIKNKTKVVVDVRNKKKDNKNWKNSEFNWKEKVKLLKSQETLTEDKCKGKLWSDYKLASEKILYKSVEEKSFENKKKKEKKNLWREFFTSLF